MTRCERAYKTQGKIRGFENSQYVPREVISTEVTAGIDDGDTVSISVLVRLVKTAMRVSWFPLFLNTQRVRTRRESHAPRVEVVILVTTTVVVEVTLSAPVEIGTIALVDEGPVPVVPLCPFVTRSLLGSQSLLYLFLSCSHAGINAIPVVKRVWVLVRVVNKSDE